MNCFKIMKKRTQERRVIVSVILLILGLILILANVREINRYIDGPVVLEGLTGEDRMLKEHMGEYVSITVTDMKGYVNGYDGEQKGTKFGIFPTKKSGWIVGYKGCLQYCELITYGKYNDKFEETYKQLLEFDKGNIDKPEVSINITGKVVKRTGVWDDYFEKYAKELVDANKYESVQQVKSKTGGEYMIDMSQSTPMKEELLLVVGIVLILIAVFIQASYYFNIGGKKLKRIIKEFNGKYDDETIINDYNEGRVIGSTVVSEKFVYYNKGINTEMIRLQDIDSVNRVKLGFVTKISITELDGRKKSFYVKVRYGKKIVKLLVAVLKEIDEFGIEE